MSAAKKPSCLRIFIFFLAGLLCLGTIGVVWAVDGIPRLVEKDFGKPASTIDRVQLIIYSIQLLSVRQQALEPVNLMGTKQAFKVEMGQSITRIALNLENAGLIRNAATFRLFLIYSGLDTSIQAGEYQLSPAQNTVEIAVALQNAVSTEVDFRILPGWRLEEIAAALPTSGIKVTPEQFIEEARHPSASSIPLSFANIASFEGFFFPDTYRFNRDVSAKDMVTAFLKRFDEKVTSDLRTAFQKQGLNLSRAVILASMIQREAMVTKEQPMIASVFYNRLSRNMKLESDPTVQYAIGYNQSQGTWWTNPLTTSQLKVNSPYNTYQVANLPPGAIANPGLDALQAVAYPAQSPYYYFRAKCDGSSLHNFAISFEEHVNNGCP